MIELDEDLRAALGLSEGDELETVLDEPAPVTGIVRGLSAEATLSRAADLSRAITKNPGFKSIEAQPPAEIEIDRWVADPRVLIVNPGTTQVRSGGASSPFPDLGYVLDGRDTNAALRVERPDEAFVILTLNGHIAVTRLRRGAGMQAPTVGALLHGHAVPAWFKELVAALLSSGSDYDKAAGVGLCARLAASLAFDPRAGLERMMEGAETPAERVASWASQLGSTVLQGLEQDVITELDAQHEAVRAVRILAADSNRAGRDVLQALCEQRDNLESVLQVLRATGRLEASRVVATLDREAIRAASTFAMLGSRAASPRLAAVRAVDPDAWWGQDP